ncbi:MAG: 1-acyl-sn-glycerol-3-phosphate acyltransferase, partial [Propionibacteriaceae bacterium]
MSDRPDRAGAAPRTPRPGREVTSVAKPLFQTAWARTPAVRALREVVQVVGLTPLTHSQVSLDVHGLEELREFDRPAIIVANHASHLDTGVLLSTLPARRRRRTAV